MTHAGGALRVSASTFQGGSSPRGDPVRFLPIFGIDEVTELLIVDEPHGPI
jgi:hypothetical protein